jgi:hypothetical protein
MLDEEAAAHVRLQESLALQPQQRLADGRAAHAQLAGQRRVADARARLELVAKDAVHDGVVHLVAERNAGNGPGTTGPAHGIFQECHAETCGEGHT